MMMTFLQLVKESIATALAAYGAVAFAAIFFPSIEVVSKNWLLLVALFAVQLVLKLVFSRDAQGHLRRSTGS
jgi:uncharacterized membrane protein (DUF485 family)